MKKVLYVSNIEVPYRSEFFNQLSKKVDLTVLYERKKSSNRDENWTNSVKSNYKIEYLKGIRIKNEYSIDFKILKYVFSKKYDKVIIGCYNSPSQILAILLMRLFKKKYILNLDGEYFLDGKNFKQKIKRFLIKGAQDYLIAGEKSGENLSKYVSKERVHPYYFSSLTNKELEEHAKNINQNLTNKHFDFVINIPDTNPLISPILSVVPLQLLAYYISKNKGLDVDKPRNLAKSVTVE